MKRLLILLMFFICSEAAYSQRTVTGTVISEDNPEGIPGASVHIKGTTQGTITDVDGKYSIKVPDNNSVLIFSFIGFKTIEKEVGDQNIINVTLTTDITQLSEVVVIGYGVQEKRLSTGAISQVSEKNLEGINVGKVEQALQGQISGVIITKASGQPGSGQNVFIRGIGTNGNNSPLYVVDGLVTDGLTNINPNDIESIDVLKDAASTAIYGARGANGVIMITTKKGKENTTTFNYNGYTSVSQPWRLPELLNAEEYVELTREKFNNSNKSPGVQFPEVGQTEVDTDWFDLVSDPAMIQNHYLSATSNTDKSNLYFSLGYWDEEGVIGSEKSQYEKYTARLNSSTAVTDYLTIGENMSFFHESRESIPENNAFGSVLADAFNYDPITAPYDDSMDFGFAQSSWVQKEYINPLSRIFITNSFNKTERLQASVYATLTPIKNLKINGDYGIDLVNAYDKSFTPEYFFRSTFENDLNDIFQGFYRGFTSRYEVYANYDLEVSDHKASFVLGTSARKFSGEYAGGSRSAVPLDVQLNPNWWYINAGQDSTDQNYGGANPEYKFASVFGRLIYNFKEKYLFSATLRRDGSSKFGSEKLFGTFPSFSAGWIVSSESFWPSDFIDFFKVRASWGLNGNDRIDDFGYVSLVDNNRYTYSFGKPSNETMFFGVAPQRISNPALKWEESEMFDVGFDMNMIGGQLNLEFSYYKKTTRDLLMNGVIPGLVGNSPPILNTGEMVNQGLELSLTHKFSMSDFNISNSLNVTTLKNEATKVAGLGDDPFINGYSWPVRNFVITRMEEGQPVSYFRGYVSDGIFQSQAEVFTHLNSSGDPLQPKAQAGDIRFVDVNGDGVINDDDVTNIGKPWPDVILGLNSTISYNNFDLRLLWNANLGQDVYRTYERQDILYNNYQNTWLDRWTESNPSNEYPRLVANDINGNQRPSDFYVEDASFLRLRNAQIGYNFSQNTLEKIKLKKIRIYISLDNFLTITNYSGFDPEIGTYGWILDTGIDKGFYPQNKTIGGGLNITF